MRNSIGKSALILFLILVQGCCLTRPPQTVPVSFEGMYNMLKYYDAHCAWHYPFSCPPCPYPDPCSVAVIPVGMDAEPVGPGRMPEELEDQGVDFDTAEAALYERDGFDTSLSP